MNTSGSKDLIRKPQKRLSKRNKKGQGFFHNNHSFNLLNRNSSLQTHSYSEYVLQNPNARSYNVRLHSGRPNSGYLKHIHSQSIRREKEHSAIGCYEEYTLRKIRNTSDMIKQQLMSPEHVPITLSDTHLESPHTISVSKSKPIKTSGDASKISDINREYLSAKPKRKLVKSNEEIARLQMKQKRKNELREKFKRDNISKQKSTESYNAKEISDLIHKHISKMNNERIMDFLNSGDSRYGEAFNYICKQKSFEVTKALRDLSHQEKPEACEIVNSIIPDFSIKIEQLPINVIRELSLTFDELHKNIEGPSMLDADLFSGDGELQSQVDLSAFLEKIQNDETSEENLNMANLKTEIQIDSILQNQDIIQNTENCGNSVELIEVLDSDDEIVHSEQTDKINNQILHSMEETEESIDSKNCILSSNQIACFNTGIEEIISSDSLPCEEGTEIIVHSNQAFRVPDTSLNNACNTSSVEKDLLKNITNDSEEIAKKPADSTSVTCVDSIKVEVNPEDNEECHSLKEITDFDSQPKVGSVWVSKSIFESSTDWNIPQEHEFNEPNIENFANRENLKVVLNILSPSTNGGNLESGVGEIEHESQNLSLLETNDSQVANVGIVDEEIFEPTLIPNETSSTLSISQVDEQNNKQDVYYSPICGPEHSTTGFDAQINGSSKLPRTQENSSKVPSDSNNKNDKVKDFNIIEKTGNLAYESDVILDKSSNTSTINKDLNILAESSNVSRINSVKTTEKLFSSEKNCPENDFISLIIKPFDKPKNLKDAINFMTVIDKQIEILNKLRQDLFYGLTETSADSEIATTKSKKRKLEKSSKLPKDSEKTTSGNKNQIGERLVQKNTSSTEQINAKEVQNEKKSVQQSCTMKLGTTNEVLTGKRLFPENSPSTKTFNKNEVQIGKGLVEENNLNTNLSTPKSSRKDKKSVLEKSPNASVSSQKDEVVKKPIQNSDPKPFESLHGIKAVVLFCKIIFEKNECIVGTDNGKIHYHSIYGHKPSMTVNIGDSAISFLDYIRINDWSYVCTGNSTEFELKFLKYKRRFVEHKVHLEDSIAAVKNDWGFFFIGGKRGYLTRYDWRKDKIQFEDRISQSSIKALTATKEGPRKILVILFEDPDGVAHIHVRDAMSALHIRTIIDMKNVRCMYLRYSSVYLFTDEQISVYNCCDGNFIRKVTTQKSFSVVKSRGHLMVLLATDGIYGYNLRTNKYLGCLKSEISAASMIIYERMILCGTLDKTIELFDIPDHCLDILEYK